MTTFPLDDTIAALASPPGPAARAIVRISGPDPIQLLRPIFATGDGERGWETARPARRYCGALRLSSLRVPLPVDLALWPTRRSYTGQPLAELHLPGSPPLADALLAELHERGARPARPGEFTLRAFLAGRIDLVQAEAVLGVIDAGDQQALEAALRQLAGGLSGRIAAVRGDLLDLLADLEAGLDFVEEDIEFLGRDELEGRLKAAVATLEKLIAQSEARMRTSARLKVVLAGLPNAGKSSLLNRLAGAETALVSEHRGTTRDYLSVELDWRGTAVELIDTAGWEFDPDALMDQAQTLRGIQLERADLVLLCAPADADPSSKKPTRDLALQLEASGRQVLVLRTKADLSVGEDEGGGIAVSARTGAGVDELIDAAVSRLSAPGSGGEILGTTAARCRESLSSAATSLERALAAPGEELVAAEVREALDHLGRILGAVYTDDILDRIFSRFCIGK